MDINISINSAALQKQFANVPAALANDPNIQAGLKQAAARYDAFTRRRFVEQSKGGGDWPDLSPATKLKRARERGGTRAKLNAGIKRSNAPSRREKLLEAVAGLKFAILRDTGLLLNSISIGGPGHVQKLMPLGIRTGTAVNYARFHQDGGAKLPQRAILVDPPNAVLQQISGDLFRATQRFINAHFKP